MVAIKSWNNETVVPQINTVSWANWDCKRLSFCNKPEIIVSLCALMLLMHNADVLLSLQAQI